MLKKWSHEEQGDHRPLSKRACPLAVLDSFLRPTVIWGKRCLFEEVLRPPLIIRVPGKKQPGANSDTIVEALDEWCKQRSWSNLQSPDFDCRKTG